MLAQEWKKGRMLFLLIIASDLPLSPAFHIHVHVLGLLIIKEHHFIWNIKFVSSKLWVHQIPKGNNNLTSITFHKFLLLAKGVNSWKITLESTVAKWKQHSKWIFRNIVLLLALVVFIYKVISKRLLFSWATPIHCRAWSRCFGFSQGFLSIFFFSFKNKTTGILGTIKCCLYL